MSCTVFAACAVYTVLSCYGVLVAAASSFNCEVVGPCRGNCEGLNLHVVIFAVWCIAVQWCEEWGRTAHFARVSLCEGGVPLHPSATAAVPNFNQCQKEWLQQLEKQCYICRQKMHHLWDSVMDWCSSPGRQLQ